MARGVISSVAATCCVVLGAAAGVFAQEANTAAQATVGRPTVILAPAQDPGAQGKAIYEDGNHAFVSRNYGHGGKQVPGLFVFSKQTEKWMEIKKLSTEDAKLGRSPTIEEVKKAGQWPCSVGWDYSGLRGAAYAAIPLKIVGSPNFPDKILYEPEADAYLLRFNSGWKIDAVLTQFTVKRSDLAQAFAVPEMDQLMNDIHAGLLELSRAHRWMSGYSKEHLKAHDGRLSISFYARFTERGNGPAPQQPDHLDLYYRALNDKKPGLKYWNVFEDVEACTFPKLGVRICGSILVRGEANKELREGIRALVIQECRSLHAELVQARLWRHGQEVELTGTLCPSRRGTKYCIKADDRNAAHLRSREIDELKAGTRVRVKGTIRYVRIPSFMSSIESREPMRYQMVCHLEVAEFEVLEPVLQANLDEHAFKQALVGKWVSAFRHPSGKIVQQIEFKADGTAELTVDMGGEKKEYAGPYSVQYERKPRPSSVTLARIRITGAQTIELRRVNFGLHNALPHDEMILRIEREPFGALKKTDN